MPQAGKNRLENLIIVSEANCNDFKLSWGEKISKMLYLRCYLGVGFLGPNSQKIKINRLKGQHGIIN